MSRVRLIFRFVENCHAAILLLAGFTSNKFMNEIFCLFYYNSQMFSFIVA